MEAENETGRRQFNSHSGKGNGNDHTLLQCLLMNHYSLRHQLQG